MYFVFRFADYDTHGNGRRPEWCMIDFREKGIRTGWQLGDKYNDRVWGHDIYREIKEDPEKFLIVEAEDYAHLKMTKEFKEKWDEYVKSAIDPNSRLGWVAPDGTFIGCRYYDHEFIATEYLHSSERSLEAQGWCKLYVLTWGGRPDASDDGTVHWYTRNLHLTSAQEEVLRRLHIFCPKSCN